MPTKRALIEAYKRLFPGIRLRFVRSPRRPRKRSLRASARYEAHKEAARALVHRKLSEFGARYGFRYGRVAIRDQRTRWGSCSKQGNLNFNYRIVFLPERLVDAVIVHELCHLAEFDHSARFWERVAETIPDWRERRAELRRIDLRRL